MEPQGGITSEDEADVLYAARHRPRDLRPYLRNHLTASMRYDYKYGLDDIQTPDGFSRNSHINHAHSVSEPVQDGRHYLVPDEHILTTAEVHNYPSSESGITADCGLLQRSSSSRKHSKSRRVRDEEEEILSIEERCAKDLDEILPARFGAMSVSQGETVNAPLKWNRDNIAMTMERFEPTDYCYAYYEPGAMMRHNLSMPSTSRSKVCCQKTPSNSKNTLPKDRAARNAFIARYGTEENIYEEITDGSRSQCPKHRYAHQQSLISLSQSIVEEEVRRVENRHKRILGELNLSVEAMLMPECESSDSEKAEDRDNLEELLRVGPTDELLSPASCNPLADLDSGFSGSSSGASYVGSLRYKSGAERARSSLSFPRASTPVGSSLNLPAVAYGQKGVRILDGKQPLDYSSRCSRKVSYDTHSPRSSSCGDGTKTTSFWSKKTWKKIPGFSSSNSINKAGLSGLLVRYTFRRKSGPPPSRAGPKAPQNPVQPVTSPARGTCETCLSQRC